MSRSTATETAVVNDSTSMTTATSAVRAIAAAPVGPHSSRTRCSACVWEASVICRGAPGWCPVVTIPVQPDR